MRFEFAGRLGDPDPGSHGALLQNDLVSKASRAGCTAEDEFTAARQYVIAAANKKREAKEGMMVATLRDLEVCYFARLTTTPTH